MSKSNYKVVSELLTDKSRAWSVNFLCNGYTIKLACVDEQSARTLKDQLDVNVCWVEMDPSGCVALTLRD